MSLVKMNKIKFPSLREGLSNWFDTDELFADEFFTREETLPAMNVKENDTNFEIELAVPGFSKDDIEVSLEKNVLHVCAEKRKEEVAENETGYIRKEFSSNEFDRRMRLPNTVNQDKEVKAVYKDGVLKLQLLKKQEANETPKKVIEID